MADYDTLFELLISDRLKGALPQGPLNYVLTQEGEGWYTSEKVASLADVFVNNRATIAGQKATDGKAARVATTVATEGRRATQGHQGARGGQFPSGVEERAAHDHLPSQGRSSAMSVVVSATWPENARPVKVIPVEASVEGHEEVTEGHSVVAMRARVEASM